MSGEKTRSGARQERLARALKANLSRRKEQARTRQPAADAPAAPPPADGEDGCPN